MKFFLIKLCDNDSNYVTSRHNFFTLTHGEENFRIFLLNLNKFDENIEFTHESR